MPTIERTDSELPNTIPPNTLTRGDRFASPPLPMHRTENELPKLSMPIIDGPRPAPRHNLLI